MNRIGKVVAREIREGCPAMIFFLVLFHMIALTKAVSLNDYSVTALRAAGATVGALIVAKAILLVEALPIARLFSGRRLVVQILWKTLLYSMVALVFRVVEEIISSASRHGGVVPTAKAMYREVSWPLFGVLTLWIVGGLLLYCLASELVRAIGVGRVEEILFGLRRRSTALPRTGCR